VAEKVTWRTRGCVRKWRRARSGSSSLSRGWVDRRTNRIGRAGVVLVKNQSLLLLMLLLLATRSPCNHPLFPPLVLFQACFFLHRSGECERNTLSTYTTSAGRIRQVDQTGWTHTRVGRARSGQCACPDLFSARFDITIAATSGASWAPRCDMRTSDAAWNCKNNVPWNFGFFLAPTTGQFGFSFLFCWFF